MLFAYLSINTRVGRWLSVGLIFFWGKRFTACFQSINNKPQRSRTLGACSIELEFIAGLGLSFPIEPTGTHQLFDLGALLCAVFGFLTDVVLQPCFLMMSSNTCSNSFSSAGAAKVFCTWWSRPFMFR